MRTLATILTLLVAGLLAETAAAQVAAPGVITDGRRTLWLEHDPTAWPDPHVWLVRGTEYRERWVTISIFNADGSLFTWGPWAPGKTNTLNKPFPFFTSGASYRVEVRRGYQYTPGTGPLLISGEFSIP